jgi:hypothetical protein
MKPPNISLAIVFVLIATKALAGAAGTDDSIHVTITGTLHTGILAIGGETTGTTITAKGITWELDFGGDTALREAAESLDGKAARVQGDLGRRKGIEIDERWIVTVSSLTGAGDAAGTSLHGTTKRADSRIRFVPDGDHTVIDITSTSGIGSATIKRGADEEWPQTILARLHLRGLESFKATAGDVTVEWSVASSGDHPSRATLRKGGGESPLGDDSPYHSKAKIVGGDGSIPVGKDGYFEIPLPAKLFEGNPPEITLQWIDFYRN